MVLTKFVPALLSLFYTFGLEPFKCWCTISYYYVHHNLIVNIYLLYNEYYFIDGGSILTYLDMDLHVKI